MSNINKNITWHDILDIILMFVMIFLTLFAIAKEYYGAIEGHMGSNLNTLHDGKISVWLVRGGSS